MPATKSSDFVFEPKVWKDHIAAYFDRKLVFGAIATRDDSLKSQPGETINFPYFKKIGDVEEPNEDDGLAVDKLSDDSFNATVKEVAKAVGIKRKAFKKSAATKEKIISEIQSQLATVNAEKVDKDLVTELGSATSYEQGYTATAAANVLSVKILNQAKVVGFGDKHTEAMAVQMHSLSYLEMMNDSTQGFLKADATDPMFGQAGYQGRLLGMAVFVSDSCPKHSVQIDGKDAYYTYIHKVNPYGIIMKQDMELESDYDLLQREWVFTSNQWYAVKSFHAKISDDDKKTVRLTTTVS